MTEHSENDTETTRTGVRYNAQNHFNVRTIYAHEWQSIGIDDMPSVQWNRANNWTLPITTFTPAALRYVATDPDLELF